MTGEGQSRRFQLGSNTSGFTDNGHWLNSGSLRFARSGKRPTPGPTPQAVTAEVDENGRSIRSCPKPRLKYTAAALRA